MITARLAVCFGLAATLWNAGPILAATLTVTNALDSGAGSLRRTIQDAAPGDTLNFSITGTITLTNGQLLITNDLSIDGPGTTNLAISGNRASRAFEIASNITVRISGLTLRDGHASDDTGNGFGGSPGGGVYNAGTLMLTACAVSGNRSGNGSDAFGGFGGRGGGIYNAGALTLNRCIVSGNICGGGGGSFAPGNGGSGGGLYNAGTVALNACTFGGNAGGPGGNAGVNGFGSPGGKGGDGGGIFNASTLTLTAGTLSGNSGGTGGAGRAGVFNGTGGRGGNGGSGGGIFNGPSPSTANLRTVLVALNSVGYGGPSAGAQPRGDYGVGWDLAGSFISQGHNLIGQTDGGLGFTNGALGDQTGTTITPLDAKLGPLTNNGGSTLTMALLPGSPAIDAGNGAGLLTDQRGRVRPIDNPAITNASGGDGSDIGAFEFQSQPITLMEPVKTGSNIVVSFLTEAGLTYRIERKNVLTPGLWTTISNNIAGTGALVPVFDPGAANQPQRFYRGRTIP